MATAKEWCGWHLVERTEQVAAMIERHGGTSDAARLLVRVWQVGGRGRLHATFHCPGAGAMIVDVPMGHVPVGTIFEPMAGRYAEV
jgi:hypothetical protein